MSDFGIAIAIVIGVIVALEVALPIHAVGFHIIRERLRRRKESPNE